MTASQPMVATTDQTATTIQEILLTWMTVNRKTSPVKVAKPHTLAATPTASNLKIQKTKLFLDIKAGRYTLPAFMFYWS